MYFFAGIATVALAQQYYALGTQVPVNFILKGNFPLVPGDIIKLNYFIGNPKLSSLYNATANVAIAAVSNSAANTVDFLPAGKYDPTTSLPLYNVQFKLVASLEAGLPLSVVISMDAPTKEQMTPSITLDYAGSFTQSEVTVPGDVLGGYPSEKRV